MKFTEEDKIQQSIVNAIRKCYPRSFVFSVPNGGFRFKSTAIVLKCTGAVAGVSDLVLLHNGQTYFLEVKTKKGKMSDSQKEFSKRVSELGFRYFIVRSAEGALELIKTL